MENFSWKPEGERDVDTTPRGDSVFLNSGHASNDERDADQLARLGKKPVLKVDPPVFVNRVEWKD